MKTGNIIKELVSNVLLETQLVYIRTKIGNTDKA